MYFIILFALITKINSNFLAAENNFHKPSLERNNKINKGVWLRNNLNDPQNGQNFFVGSNSLDAEHAFQNNFDAFKQAGLEEIPVINTYFERAKRSADSRKRQSRKTLKSKNQVRNTLEDKINNRITDNTFKLYPLKIAAILNRVKNVKTDPTVIDLPAVTEIENDIEVKNETKNLLETDKPYIELQQDPNTEKVLVQNATDAPKRNKKYDYEIVNEHKNTNDTDRNKKNAGGIVNNPELVWQHKALAHDSDLYEVVDKEPEKNKITERGLVKVITMLTKTFKKLTKQHSDIKQIHDKLINMNEDFYKKITDMNEKFKDFGVKYREILQFNDKVKEFQDKLATEMEFFKTKHTDMDNNIVEFENQQKKFLAQQRQFYTIQKLMISQNEKINQKQNMISKTQSEISFKQNNFARILKKAKQLIVDAKTKINHTNNIKEQEITTQKPVATTDIVKINLFSIPTKTKLENKDALIMKEKDYQPIDELVYKYYFNNTFIDNFMKNNILNNYPSMNGGSSKNGKIKREKVMTTIMLPLKKRSKRSFGNGSRKVKRTDAKKKTDPFLEMATNFCNEIKQNKNKQILSWCVEKALRRLRFMDKKLFSEPTVMKAKPMKSTTTETPTSKKIEKHEYQTTQMYPVVTKRNTAIGFFPDNEELEYKLKEYELIPDKEGNVYFDGSLHLSDITHHEHKTKDSEGTSDIMPGLMDSNSKVELDTFAFDLQAKRRAFVKRLNENILRQYKIG